MQRILTEWRKYLAEAEKQYYKQGVAGGQLPKLQKIVNKAYTGPAYPNDEDLEPFLLLL